MRDENSNGAAANFNLVDLGAALASNGNLVLRHSVTEAVAGSDAVINATVKDATGSSDTVAITVENDLNTGTTFDYTLTATGTDTDNVATGAANDADKVENISIADNDTESNIVTLTNVGEHTGTVTLTGGQDAQTYTVASSLVAGTVDAEAQKSDLRLTVGSATATTKVTQTIKLGEGDDILTFQNIDDFQAADSITDAGGSDTVRAAFSEDSNLSLANIENLHIIANENVELGMANAGVDKLVILADIAADGDNDNSPATAEPFNIAGVTTSDIITLSDTNLTELNFSADLDDDDSGDTGAGVNDDIAVANANFNGVTLKNNSANALTVNINSALDFVDIGATAYNLGQLTTHGITSMDIKVADEDVETTVTGATATTTINNIFAKNMTSLTVEAKGDVNLNTVSGAALNNSLTTFDASKVEGDLTANVISLGDNATVTLANGDHTFSALGSAGKSISITSGNGTSNITGSAQSDTITTGTGNDTIAGDRGDNVITAGAGNDVVTAKDGNDTVDLGTGIDSYTDNLNTNINAILATNTVSKQDGIASVQIDTDGAGGFEVDQMLAVGAGSTLTVSWTGATMATGTAVLDGRLATVDSQVANVVTGDANSNLEIMTAAADITVNGGAGNDVALVTDQTTASLTFNGGAGNDGAVGGVDSDIFTGGAGADQIAVQNTQGVDGNVDTVVIADGDSTASAWDVIFGFEAGGVAAAANVVAGSATAGDDVLDLDTTVIEAAAANVDGTDSGTVESHTVTGANGLITFDTDDSNAFAAVVVGTGTGQISLSDALGYLAANIDGGATVAFQYDSDGNGAVDQTFVFQDGVNDTVVQLVGVFNGVEAVTGGTAGIIEIA